jgi:hypothetical protein
MKYTVRPGRITLAYLLTAFLGSLVTLLGLAVVSAMAEERSLLGVNNFGNIPSMFGYFVVFAFILGLPVFLIVLLASWVLQRRGTQRRTAVPIMLCGYVAAAITPMLLFAAGSSGMDLTLFLPFSLGYVIGGAFSLYFLALRVGDSTEPLETEVLDLPY